ncbi:MAG: glycosyltransferase family 2 protein [Rhodobiaceae bacterium]|nr:glycosyltransferase family 2 protein [Rhodobiaceae bacterium]MCC0047779.1 glycosyltransferase family 2 protein [Rhodobiaceae bacterium]
MPRLSAIVITLNEAANIGDCLDSVAFCNERIVLDSGSTDDTCAIARQHGARVEHQDWLGYGRQKNAALELATGDWMLSIDADERIPAQLAAEIALAVEKGAYDGYEMPRLSRFLGKPMRYSGWYPDYQLRLFRRGKARFSDDAVHERVILDGTRGRLKTHIDHMTTGSLEAAIGKADRYSTLSAERIAASDRRVRFWEGVTHGAWSFIRAYFLKLGFLDGKEGFLIAVLNAEGSYYRYMKAWLIQRQKLRLKS